MKIMFLFFLFILASLGGLSQKSGPPVRILDATEKYWISGAPGGRTGTNYAIRVFVNTAEPLEFLYLWIGKQNVPFQLEMMNLEIQKKVAFGDSVIIFHSKVNGEPYPSFEPKRLPLSYRGAALIQCKVNGKARYFVVKKFRKLADSYGP